MLFDKRDVGKGGKSSRAFWGVFWGRLTDGHGVRLRRNGESRRHGSRQAKWCPYPTSVVFRKAFAVGSFSLRQIFRLGHNFCLNSAAAVEVRKTFL